MLNIFKNILFVLGGLFVLVGIISVFFDTENCFWYFLLGVVCLGSGATFEDF